jgi:hypothetical protein
LLLPAGEAYDLLAERLRGLGRTPLLRKDGRGAGEEVLALPLTLAKPKPRVTLALTLFGLTVLSCLFVGAQMVEGLSAINRNLWMAGRSPQRCS